MPLFEILMLAVGLGMDACVVSAGAGATGRTRGVRGTFRLGFHFGLFQFLMPIVGWFAGRFIADQVQAVDHWVAFAILAFIGGRMIRNGLQPEPDPEAGDPSKGWSLVMLSIATSIDALAVGFSLAMIDVNIWVPAVMIGLITAAMSVAGRNVGARLGDRFGHRMEIVGGVILIFVGAKIVVDNLAV
jgi:putative Mn2+ efflux pump MntP